LAQQDSGHDEWVNAWAETAQAAPKAEPFVVAPAVLPHVAQPISISPDQLMRDIAESNGYETRWRRSRRRSSPRAARRLSPWFRRARPMRFRW